MRGWTGGGGDTGIRGTGVKGAGNGDKGGGDGDKRGGGRGERERGNRGGGTEIFGAGVIPKFVVIY